MIGRVKLGILAALGGEHHRSDLRSLTMLAWANILPSKGLLRSHRAWCSDCLREHATVYEPLLWCIAAVEVCPRHGRPLTSRCPHCSETLPVLGWHTWPGQCSECLGYLHDDSARSDSDNVASFHQLWTANTVGEMLVGSQDEPISRERLMEALRFWTPSGTTGTTASLLEKNWDTVRMWLTGRRLPKLGTLLEICHKLETSPLPFFNLAQPAPRSQRTATASTRANRPKKPTPRRKLKLTELRVELESARRNKGVRPPSTTEVSRHLGHAKTTLYRHFPELCRAISLAHMAWRVECGVRRRQGLVEEVRKIAASLHEVGREPTLREVASRMAKPGAFRDPSARVALAQIRLELGPVPAWAVVDHSVENAEA
jgi:hypothetical protein